MTRTWPVLVTLSLVATTMATASAPATAAEADGLLYSTYSETTQRWSLVRSDLAGSGKLVLRDSPDFISSQLSPDQAGVAIFGLDGLEILPTAGGGAAVPLSDVFVHSPRWSADSDRLAAIEEEQVDGSTVERLRVFEADGSGSQTLFTADADELAGLVVAGWAPDGTTVVFSGYHQTSPANTLGYFRVSASGGAPVELTGTRAVSMSPLGTHAFGAVANGTGLDLVRLAPDLRSSTVVHTFPDAATGWSPQMTWSADGSRFGAIGLTEDLDQSFVVLGAGGSTIEVIEDLPNEGTFMHYQSPALSPDGGVIAFYAQTASNQYQYDGIYLHDLSRGRSCQVTDIYEHGSGLWPVFAFDGETLLIVGGSRLRSLDLSAPGRKLTDVSIPDGASLGGLLGAVRSPEAVPCDRTRIRRHIRVEPRRVGGESVLNAYVFGVPDCDNRVPVKLQRRRSNGGWKTVASDRTNRKHTAVFDRPRRGTFRALAPKVNRGNLACLKATSDAYRP